MKWITVFLISCFLCVAFGDSIVYGKNTNIDFDPLVDLSICIKIHRLRSYVMEKEQYFAICTINNNTVVSPVWNSTTYSCEPDWNITMDIPDDEPFVSVSLTVYDSQGLCDLCSNSDKKQVDILFDVRTGHWFGDDMLGDQSGYGRTQGRDDGNPPDGEHDCELLFDLFLNDYDNDMIPYCVEVDNYQTDPTIDDSTLDPDLDEIPTSWEWKWGYDPNHYDNFSQLDEDADGLANTVEYMMRQWNTDPFRKDIFLEIDQMEAGPNNEGSWMLTEGCKELLQQPFHARNIVLHIDDGCMGGGNIIPFTEVITNKDLIELYNRYFLENSERCWKRDIFHYGLIIYHHEKAAGKAFIGEGFPINSNVPGINSFEVSKTAAELTLKKNPYGPDFIYATYIMHELAHTFGIDIFNPPGCDNRNTVHPLCYGWWLYANYKSVMNYRYVHDILDYSDGTHGKHDYDDWGNLDFSFFKLPKDKPFFTVINQWYLHYLKLE